MEATNKGGHKWKSMVDLGLMGDLQVEWNHFIQGLMHSGIQLSNVEDSLLWSWNVSSGQVIAKQTNDSIVYLCEMERKNGGTRDNDIGTVH